MDKYSINRQRQQKQGKSKRCSNNGAIVATAGIGNVDVAVWRAVNVILGSLLSMVCSRLFFPSRAFIHYQVLIATFLEAVGDYYLIHTKKILGNEQPIHNNFDKLIENLVQQQSLLDHLAKEKKRFKKISLEHLYFILRN
jgi:uncharacterized membrane protein YccC